MKRFMYSCFVAFWASVASIWGFAVLAASVPPPQQAAGTAPAGSGITPEVLAEHATEDDCWMAVDGIVYDVTDYIPLHPTPASVMIPWCGKEATEAYRTKGYGRPHSPAADAMLPQYRIGPLADESDSAP